MADSGLPHLRDWQYPAVTTNTLATGYVRRNRATITHKPDGVPQAFPDGRLTVAQGQMFSNVATHHFLSRAHVNVILVLVYYLCHRGRWRCHRHPFDRKPRASRNWRMVTPLMRIFRHDGFAMLFFNRAGEPAIGIGGHLCLHPWLEAGNDTKDVFLVAGKSCSPPFIWFAGENHWRSL